MSLTSEDVLVPSRGGRPRDPRIERAVLKATAELLVKRGYSDLNLDEIAARAKTTKPAIYRRWKSKAHLVHEAAFPIEAIEMGNKAGAATRSLGDDVHDMVESAARVLASPVARAAFPGLVAEFETDPDLHASLLRRFQTGPMAWAAQRLESAIQNGEARPGVELQTIVAAIGGAVFFRLLVEAGAPCDEDWINRTTDLVMKGVLP